jgi:multidrug efflux pump subunit AcrA (membrane-fusion protein)
LFNPFDGSDRPLSYGQALVLCAERVSWPDEILARKVVDAIRAEHGLTLPAPDEPTIADPKIAVIHAQNQQLAEAQAELATLRAAQARRDRDDQLASVRAEVAEQLAAEQLAAEQLAADEQAGRVRRTKS